MNCKMNSGAYSLFSSEVTQPYDPTLVAECTKLLNKGIITNSFADEIKKYSTGDLVAGNQVKESLNLIKLAQSVGYKTGKLKKKPKTESTLPAPTSLATVPPPTAVPIFAPPPQPYPQKQDGALPRADYSRKTDAFSALSPMPSYPPVQPIPPVQPMQPMQPMQGGKTFRRNYNQNRTLRR